MGVRVSVSLRLSLRQLIPSLVFFFPFSKNMCFAFVFGGSSLPNKKRETPVY